jgi:hypothetical protein
MGSRKKAPMLAAAFQDRRPVYPPAACRSCSSCVAVRSSAPAGHCRPALPQPRAGTRRGDPVERQVPQPVKDLARTRSRLRTVAVAHFRRLRVPWRCQPGHPVRAESGKAPPCMRWRGPARPRRTGWLVAWPCWHSAPPAGAAYPCEGPVSRLLPRSRGRPQVVPVSER